jgi:3-oxoacyl-[acyl-carrier-protein] synthase II
MTERRRVVVTGLGVIAANGIGLDAFWDANRDGISGVTQISRFDISGFATQFAAEVKEFNPELYMPLKTAKSTDRFVHFGVASAGMALDNSGIDLDKLDRERTGVIIGSGMGGALFHEEQIMISLKRGGAHRADPSGVTRATPNAVAAHIAIQFGLLGPNFVIATACASGNHAIGEAFRKIQYNEADVVIAGGAEAPLTEYTFGAFYSMRALSRSERPPKEVSRPFDAHRDGFVMGEGGAILILEERNRALERNAHIYGEIVGYGLTSGAFHMALPEPNGADAARAMKLALQDASLAPEQVDYINAHGTSTRANDVSETKAIKTVFGNHFRNVPVSSTKSMIGHAIGAAPAIEAVASCLAIEHQTIPPTINYTYPDPECDLNIVANHPRKAQLDVVMSNAFGFGSVNACIVIKKHDVS